MSGMLGLIIMFGIIFLCLLYLIIRYAIEEGTLNALMKYECIKSNQVNDEQ